MILTIVGQPSCRPCVQMKNQLLDRVEELTALNVQFKYIDLNSLDDKDTFIQKHNLTATPTILIEKEGSVIVKMDGYVDTDSLLGILEENK